MSAVGDVDGSVDGWVHDETVRKHDESKESTFRHPLLLGVETNERETGHLRVREPRVGSGCSAESMASLELFRWRSATEKEAR